MFAKIVSRWLVLPVALAALGVGSVPATAHADAPDPFKVLVNAFGVAHRAAPTTLLVGDSLVLNLDAQAMADHMSKVTGRSTVVAASAGASTKNFVTDGWLHDPVWGGPALTTIGNYSAYLKAGITIIALGSNDARIMTHHRVAYAPLAYVAALIEAIDQAKTHSTCVFLVNVADHWGAVATSPNIGFVNQSIDGATAYSWANKVFKIDWASYSAGQDSWFAAPDDIHHSPAGELYYADFITRAVDERIRAGLC